MPPGAEGLDLSDAEAVTRCARPRRSAFATPKDGGETRVIVNSHDATDELRTETAGAAASAIAAFPGVRAAFSTSSAVSARLPGWLPTGATWAP